MYEVPESPEQYLAKIRNGDWTPDGLRIPDGTGLYITVMKLFHGRLRRKNTVKRIFRVLAESRYLSFYQLRFRLLTKEMAYMTDAGPVCFSLRAVYGGNGAALVKLVLHEAAHMWLSEQDGYYKLKALQKAFCAQYGGRAPAVFLPIEYYAVTLSVKMLDRLSGFASGAAASAIAEQTEREKAKLSPSNLSV